MVCFNAVCVWLFVCLLSELCGVYFEPSVTTVEEELQIFLHSQHLKINAK